MEYVLIIILAYLLGTVPNAVWIGKLFYGVDVRQHGSGNSGATNTFRVLGKTAGSIVLALDVLKGWLAVILAHLVQLEGMESDNIKLVLAITAALGHIFPLYMKFKGGKGVATLLGAVIGIHWQTALLALAVFIIVLFISKFVSLASICASVSFPLILIFVFKVETTSLIVFSVVAPIAVIVTHRKNIKRLLKGQESRAPVFADKTS